MARLFAPLVVVVTLLSIASLGLGTALFQQREVLKGRILKLEAGHQAVARSLGYEGMDSARLQDLQRMEAPLRALNQFAKNTVDVLHSTSNQLVETEGELSRTEATLGTARQELEAARSEVAKLEDNVTEQESELAAQARLIEDLESLRDELSAQVDGLRNDLDVTQSDLRDRMAEIVSWREDYEKLVEECTQVAGVEAEVLEVDFFGRVLAVSPDWNLVVIEGGADRQLKPNVDLLVHRDEEVLGKIRVQSVEQTLSVAEVVVRWSEEAIAAGDRVISPERPKPGGAST